MLLTADAEAEAMPLDPGPVDVLKVAHHGSDDAGLGALLDRTRPRLAVISVGAGNPYGHPTAARSRPSPRHGVRTLRTDLDGTVEIDVRGASMEVRAEAERACCERTDGRPNIGSSRSRRLRTWRDPADASTR